MTAFIYFMAALIENEDLGDAILEMGHISAGGALPGFSGEEGDY